MKMKKRVLIDQYLFTQSQSTNFLFSNKFFLILFDLYTLIQYIVTIDQKITKQEVMDQFKRQETDSQDHSNIVQIKGEEQLNSRKQDQKQRKPKLNNFIQERQELPTINMKNKLNQLEHINHAVNQHSQVQNLKADSNQSSLKFVDPQPNLSGSYTQNQKKKQQKKQFAKAQMEVQLVKACSQVEVANRPKQIENSLEKNSEYVNPHSSIVYCYAPPIDALDYSTFNASINILELQNSSSMQSVETYIPSDSAYSVSQKQNQTTFLQMSITEQSFSIISNHSIRQDNIFLQQRVQNVLDDSIWSEEDTIQQEFLYSINKIKLEDLGKEFQIKADYVQQQEEIKDLLKFIKATFGENSQQYKEQLEKLEKGYYKNGDYQNAKKYQEKREEEIKNKYGDKGEQYGVWLNNMGMIYDKKGELDKALKYYFKSLQIKKTVLGQNHPDYAISLNNIGVTYDSKGDLDKALEYYFKSLQIKKTVLGQNHPDYATSLNNIGSTYQSKGDFDKALKYYFKSLQINKIVLGQMHPNYAGILNNIGSTYDNKGDFDKALQYYFKSLQINKIVLGQKHPDYARTLNNIKSTYDNKRDLNKALSCSQGPILPRNKTQYKSVSLLSDNGDLTKREKQNNQEENLSKSLKKDIQLVLQKQKINSQQFIKIQRKNKENLKPQPQKKLKKCQIQFINIQKKQEFNKNKCLKLTQSQLQMPQKQIQLESLTKLQKFSTFTGLFIILAQFMLFELFEKSQYEENIQNGVKLSSNIINI